MKFQNKVNADSEAWNRWTSAASVNVGGCSTNEISGIRLLFITRMSSQIMVPSTSRANTGDAPTKTLAKPAWPGKNGRLVSCQTCRTQAARPSKSAISAVPNQTCFLPALIWVRPTEAMIALTTTRPMIRAPWTLFGGVRLDGYQLPNEFSDRR